MKETVLENIFLQLGDHYFNLAKVIEKHKGSENDFIKIRIKESLPNRNGQNSKIRDTEFTLHDNRIQKKEVFPVNVRLLGDYKGNITEKREHYNNIYPNIGYSSFSGSVLVVHQVSFQTGFVKDLCINKDEVQQGRLLELDVEYDDPFWLGIIFSKKTKEYIQSFFRKQDLSEYRIVECTNGIVGIAVKKLTPEWEKYKLPKDRHNLSRYTEHEHFYLKNLY